MMFSRYLASAANIMTAIGGQDDLAASMNSFSASIKTAITTYGIVTDPKYGKVYAYEVDGYGSGMHSFTPHIS